MTAQAAIELPAPSLLIELGWPARALHPNTNSIGSPWPKRRAGDAAFKEGYGATKAQMHGASYKHDGQRLSFVITAYPPTKARMDDDNLIAALKRHRDGIAKALGVDDKFFDQRLQWGEPVKGGRVVVEVRQ